MSTSPTTTAQLAAMVPTAVAARTRAAFEALLAPDVHWHDGTDGTDGRHCHTRGEAGQFYATLLATGLSVSVAGVTVDDPYLDVRLSLTWPGLDQSPVERAARLLVRDGLIAEITETPPGAGILDALTTDPDAGAAAAAVDAVRTGDLASLNQVLASHPQLATTRLTRHGGRTLLHVATDWPGHLPNVAVTITALVLAGADPDAPGSGTHPETPLHWAASSDDVEALDALLDAGATIDARGAVIGGGTPLADATAFGQWNAARRLVERGARTTLWEAAALGLLDRVRDHLTHGSTTPEQITDSFWGACHGGQLGTAAYLLDQGADLDWVGYDGLTPLDAARRSHADDLAAWLLDRGARTADPAP